MMLRLTIVTTIVFRVSSAWAAEPLKPYVVLILDTSGSMSASTNAGPPTCGGGDTRIEHAVCAINKIVNSYGDMVFALGRFRETTSTNGTFTTCDANADLDGNPGITLPAPSGGDQCGTQGAYCGDCDTADGTSTGTLGPCTTADREFELLTPLVDGSNALATLWTDRGCGTCSAPPAGTLPTTANEIWGISPFTFTPLAAVLNGAKRYWLGLQATDATVIWPSGSPGFAPIASDPTSTAFLPGGCDSSPACATNCCASQCRPYITILLTDGAETCTVFGNTTAAASAMLQTDVAGRRYRVETKPIGFGIAPGNAQIEAIAQAGGAPDLPGSNEGFYAQNEAELQLAISAILRDAIKTESCNSLDDDCDALIDEDFPGKGGACTNGLLGACRTTGTLVCRADGTGLQCNAPAGPAPSTEVCNTLDDDCDGKVDEGLAGCTCIPQGESCNNLDDDCDTLVDEGLTRACGQGTCTGIETCSAGVYGGCTAPPSSAEVCDGLDNNCDGIRDGLLRGCSAMPPVMGFPAGDPRNNPGDPARMPIPQNICRPGQQSCPANVGPPNSFGPCLGEQMPQIEICNNLDDDCDNLIDEGTGGAQCGTNCGVGTTACVNGVIQCTVTTAASDPTCNNVDDDCDMKIDEDWQCATPPNCPCTGSAICNGVEKCIAGAVVCQGMPLAQESCNCSDDDCDTLVDEGSLCGAGATCTNCQCAFACAPGEFPCPAGKLCAAGFCVADPCFNVTCPDPAQVCKGVDNSPTCVAACDPTLVTCPTGQVCVPAGNGKAGECKPDDCTTFPARCAANESCVNGMCVGNPCSGVTCPQAEYCVAGACVGTCSGVTCPAGQRCRLGVCEPDPCETCPPSLVCHDPTGQCIDDPCSFVQCPQGQYCNKNNNGECEDDPCVVFGITCPDPAEVCYGGTCAVPVVPDEERVTTGGGGGCSAGGGGSVAFGLALLLATRRRRRTIPAHRGGAS